VHGRPREKVSETWFVENLHRQTGNDISGERLGVIACWCSSSSSLACCFTSKSGDSYNSMGDRNNSHGDATTVATFPVAM
jgi:hypothetical protein